MEDLTEALKEQLYEEKTARHKLGMRNEQLVNENEMLRQRVEELLRQNAEYDRRIVDAMNKSHSNGYQAGRTSMVKELQSLRSLIESLREENKWLRQDCGKDVCPDCGGCGLAMHLEEDNVGTFYEAGDCPTCNGKGRCDLW